MLEPAAPDPVPTVVLFTSHLVTPGIVRQFQALRRACPPHITAVWLMHAPPGAQRPRFLRNTPLHFVTTTEIRTPDYPAKSAGGPEWIFHSGGHTDLPVLHFYRQHPNYERYWYIEYDVRFSGRWETFFAAFENSKADLLTTTIRSAAADPDWWIWFKFGTPEGPSAVVPGFRWEQRMGAFMPVFRASRRAMETMDAAYREGWSGHLEVTWPTILHNAGLLLEDIGGAGAFTPRYRRTHFYSNTLLEPSYYPGSFVYRPLKWPVFRLKRNYLWHPVKTFKDSLKESYWAMRSALIRWRYGDAEAYEALPVSQHPYYLEFMEETDDHLAYREGRNPDGPLSVLGEHVMCSLLRSGMTDEQVGAQMSVPAEDVARRRARWGREQAALG